jgi:hypothetical protein
MKLKRYNDYVNEDLQPMMDQEEEILTPEMDEVEDMDMGDEDLNSEEDLLDSDEETHIGNHMDDEEMGEEEGYEYKGTLLMKELADRLGSKVVNNSIDYNGKKINYFSETEAFHVDKMKFETVDEVVDHLTK